MYAPSVGITEANWPSKRTWSPNPTCLFGQSKKCVPLQRRTHFSFAQKEIPLSDSSTAKLPRTATAAGTQQQHRLFFHSSFVHHQFPHLGGKNRDRTVAIRVKKECPCIDSRGMPYWKPQQRNRKYIHTDFYRKNAKKRDISRKNSIFAVGIKANIICKIQTISK